ncbi:hypothetical protein [Alteribacter populi]|uniref:hypothetical protein n=1 Tax=Alteribacter populi TaxID=2011011 RepID=UPI000BBB07AE|nr:hypothetical protein [Alteribacter populi]
MSNPLRIKRIDPDQLNVILIITTIIMVLCSVILPFVFIVILQDVFFFSRDNWILVAPTSAYYTFGGGMLWASLVMIIYVIVHTISERKNKHIKHSWLFIPIGLLFIPICTLGIMNYYYVDDEGFHINELTSYTEDEYPWESIAQVQPVGEENGHYYTHYIFITDNGNFTIGFDDKFAQQRGKILRTLEEHGTEILQRIEE